MDNTIRIEIAPKTSDHHLDNWAKQAQNSLGISLEKLEEVKVYKLSSHKDLKNTDTLKKLNSVFVDPLLQEGHTTEHKYNANNETPSFIVEVSFRPGVTDNPARSAEEALSLLDIKAKVASGSLYFMYGDIKETEAKCIAEELLANNLIQKADVFSTNTFYNHDRFKDVSLPKVLFSKPPQVENISLDIDDDALEKLSLDRCLALTVHELKHIRKTHPNPTDVELEVIAQTWSEHCKHKIFSAKINYTDSNKNTKTIDSLYRSYIKKATKDIEKSRKLNWLISVFSDNAGIVRFDKNIDLCIKAETHNSPSALDPYGGALTGILGVNRDILGAGMGAKPIANMDVFCFAEPDMPRADEKQFMPKGPKPPRRILEGVHKGVEDGGNKSGIPTVNGAFFFDRDYAGKPLVFVGTVGMMPPTLPDGRPSAEKKLYVGDRIMMIGGEIGADGIHGATFSSLELNDNAPSTAVQIGDPLTQKRMTDFLLAARDLGLYTAITDNGAGGLSSSVGEMALMSNGAELDLALCPVKYPGLSPWELMISESQERMTLAVSPKKADEFIALAEKYGVIATDIGHFNDTGNLTILYEGKITGELNLDFLHNSLPQMELTAEWKADQKRKPWSKTTKLRDTKQKTPDTIKEKLITLLKSPNITSKEKWVRSYDHEVQAATHQKPFTGKESDGPADAGVIWLKPHGGEENNAIAIGCGLAPRISEEDTYLMAQYAVDEAMRNVVVSGGDPDMCCLLDNFCWPDPVLSSKNPHGSHKLAQLIRACEGLYDICIAYGAPLVSGKDSMKNDFHGKDQRGEKIAISVLPTLLITAMAKSEIGLTVGSDFKSSGDLIYLLGDKHAESISGSEFSCHFECDEKISPLNLEKNISLYRKLHQSLKQKLIQSAHDLSEGGLLVALAESMIGGRTGAEVILDDNNNNLFGEAPGRILVSITPDQRNSFEDLFSKDEAHLLGTVTELPALVIKDKETIPLDHLTTAWQKGF